jgi:hypothetical protein
MNAPLEKSLLDTLRAPHFPIYMDYSSTTPVDPRVADKMIPYLREQFGNPASRSHMYGWSAEKAVEEARAQVAALVNADPREIIWTSGATEGNNLALKGAAHFYQTKGKHIITVKTEHKAVLDTVRELERQGFEATYLQPQDNGLITIEQLAAAIRPDTILVSVMWVNNEIGVIQPIEQIGEILNRRGLHLWILGNVIPTPQLHGLKRIVLVPEIVDFRLGHHPTLIVKTLERCRRQLGQVLRFDRAQITLGCHMQPNRIGDSFAKIGFDPAVSPFLVGIVEIFRIAARHGLIVDDVT